VQENPLVQFERWGGGGDGRGACTHCVKEVVLEEQWNMTLVLTSRTGGVRGIGGPERWAKTIETNEYVCGQNMGSSRRTMPKSHGWMKMTQRYIPGKGDETFLILLCKGVVCLLVSKRVTVNVRKVYISTFRWNQGWGRMSRKRMYGPNSVEWRAGDTRTKTATERKWRVGNSNCLSTCL